MDHAPARDLLSQHDCKSHCNRRDIDQVFQVDKQHPTAKLEPVIVRNAASDRFGRITDGEMTIVGVETNEQFDLEVPINQNGRYELVVWCDWDLRSDQLAVRNRVAGTMGKIDDIEKIGPQDVAALLEQGGQWSPEAVGTGYKVIMTESCSSANDAIMQVTGFLGYVRDGLERRAVRRGRNTPFNKPVPFYVS